MNQTKRTTVPEMEEILEKPFPVLDHGFVRVVDYMGGDESIAQAARVSYGKGTKRVNGDRGLIRYLFRNQHSTPFEMCDLKVHVKLPIFVARQWIRHRTASVNEISARYSFLDSEFYIPEEVHTQSTDNKQGRGFRVENSEQDFIGQMRKHSDSSYALYDMLIEEDVARETARINLPQNIYTQWYWKVNLRNLLHFLSLRADPHAQWEIRQYAQIILEDIVARWVPVTYEAFLDYQIYGARFSRMELDSILEMIAGRTPSFVGMSKREVNDFWKKLEVSDDVLP